MEKSMKKDVPLPGDIIILHTMGFSGVAKQHHATSRDLSYVWLRGLVQKANSHNHNKLQHTLSKKLLYYRIPLHGTFVAAPLTPSNSGHPKDPRITVIIINL